MTTLILITTFIGAGAYLAAVPCGRLFAIPFALLAATSVPVIAFHPGMWPI